MSKPKVCAICGQKFKEGDTIVSTVKGKAHKKCVEGKDKVKIGFKEKDTTGEFTEEEKQEQKGLRNGYMSFEKEKTLKQFERKDIEIPDQVGNWKRRKDLEEGKDHYVYLNTEYRTKKKYENGYIFLDIFMSRNIWYIKRTIRDKNYEGGKAKKIIDKLNTTVSDAKERIIKSAKRYMKKKPKGGLEAIIKKGNNREKKYFKRKSELGIYNQMMKKPEYFKEKKNMKYKIVHISPEEYFKRTAKIQGTTPERQKIYVESELVKKYKKRAKQGEKMPLPSLDYEQNSQEGRHRAMVAKKLGLSKMPVLIIKKA